MQHVKDLRPFSRFYNPLRWSALTWFVVIVWCFAAIPLNLPPTESYRIDPITGELGKPIYYSSLSDYSFPVGWPFHYVEPDDPMKGLAAIPVGTPLPPPGPAAVSVMAMLANAIVILAAIAALIVLLQAFLPRFSLRWLLVAPLLFPAYWGGARLAGMVGGSTAVTWFSILVYFSPILLLLSIVLFQKPVSLPAAEQQPLTGAS